MIENLPVYGPTDPFGDEEHEPDVIVRVDFLMSREQITTALGIAWAEIAGDRGPESLSVVEVRHEVEAYLSVQAFHELDAQMERDEQRTFPPEQQRVMDLLAEIVERVYPPVTAGEETTPDLDSFPHPVQAPRYANGAVTLQTLDHGTVDLPEPRWCTGHGWQPNPYLADVTHYSVPVKASAMTDGHGLVELLVARISHAPYAVEQPEPNPVVSVVIDLEAGLNTADAHKVAQALRVAAMRLDMVTGEAERLRNGGPA